MTEKVDAIIDIARQHLHEAPLDAAHDLAHHLEVMARGLELSRHVEGEVDRDALRIAAMWHGVVPKGETNTAPEMVARYLEEKMAAMGFRQDFIDKVTPAVALFTLDQQPATLEGKVLFDAEKLELLNPQRIRRYQTAVESEKIAKDKAEGYFKAFAQAYPTLRQKLHFEQSKKMFDALQGKLKQDSTVRGIFQSYGVQL